MKILLLFYKVVRRRIGSDNFLVFQLLTVELEVGEAIVVDQGKPLYILISSLKIPLISLSL